MRASLLLVFAIPIWACGQHIEVAANDASSPDSTVADAGSGSMNGAGRDGGPASNGDADSNGDAGSNGQDAMNMMMMMAADAGQPACVVDPFMTCMDTDEGANGSNNTWADAVFFDTNHTIGCPSGGGDTVTPFDHTHSGILCPGDPADYYRVTIICCDTRTMNAEIRLHPTTACDPSDFALVFYGNSGRVDCANPDSDAGIACTNDMGDTVIRAQIPPCNVVFEWEFGIEAKNPNVSLDLTYDMRMRLQ